MANAEPLSKLPFCHPTGLIPPTTSSLESATMFPGVLRLFCHRFSWPVTLLIAPRWSLRRSEMQRFRLAEALAVKSLFTNDLCDLPVHGFAFFFQLNKMTVSMALQSPF